MRKPSAGVVPVLWSVVGALVLTAAILLVAGPGRGLRSDIDRQKELITKQLALTKQQLAITRQQLDISSKTLDIAQKQLEFAQQQLARTDLTIDMQRKLLEIAQETLNQVRELNRKTPNLGGANPEKQP
jgi:uncharacterized protein HemX